MKKKLLSALKICAKAHNVEWDFINGDYEGETFVMESAKVPLIADVQMIAEAFFGSSKPVNVESGWNITSLYFDEIPFLPKINKQLLSLALPFGAKI